MASSPSATSGHSRRNREDRDRARVRGCSILHESRRVIDDERTQPLGFDPTGDFWRSVISSRFLARIYEPAESLGSRVSESYRERNAKAYLRFNYAAFMPSFQ